MDLDDDDECIADDCTECDCSRCTGDQKQWEHWQGWHHEDGEPVFDDECPDCHDEGRARAGRPAPGTGGTTP